MPTSSRDQAVLCGGFAVCILICLYIVGIPMFVSGIVFLSVFDSDDGFTTVGVVLIVISSLFIIGGVVTTVLSIYYASKSNSRSVPEGHMVANSTTMGGQNVYQIAAGQGFQAQYVSQPNQPAPYYPTQAAAVPQYPPPYQPTAQPTAPYDSKHPVDSVQY